MKIRANCAARTHENDIRPIAEIVQRTGLNIQAATFIGSSPIRRYTEGWTDDFLLETTEKAVKFAVSLGLESMYVTEDTSRCDPEMVKRLYSTAINCGARAIVICDTAGHATPMGAFALVRFVVRRSGQAFRRADSRGLARPLRPRPGYCEFHGCPDGGRGVRARMRARNRRKSGQHADGSDAGQSETHGRFAMGRAGPYRLKEYCQAVSKATGVPIPANYPVVGEDAFRTATGVHAAAVIKAYKKKDIELANAVYSGVPSQMFGLEQIIDIGPMSGKSNVLFWLERHGVPPADDVVERIYQRAKASDHTLTEPEIMRVRRQCKSSVRD